MGNRMLYKSSKRIRTISFFAFTTLLVGLSGPGFASDKSHDNHNGHGYNKGGHGNNNGKGHGNKHSNHNSPDPDDYTLSWNQECTAVIINVEEGGKPIRKISYYDSAGNGPATIKSTREMPLDSPVDLSTTELQSYISPETGGTIWIKVGSKGKKGKRHSRKGKIELNLPSCDTDVVCPYADEFNNTIWTQFDAGYTTIEIPFYDMAEPTLDCSLPKNPITLITISIASDSDASPHNYINTSDNTGSSVGFGPFDYYNNDAQARACAIYLGCTEQ